jgi:hypothetical protein
MERDEITNRYMEIRGCKIKRSYMSKANAKAIAKKMNRITEYGKLRAYSCKFCEAYHVGHIRPSYEDRKETKRIDNVLKRGIVV